MKFHHFEICFASNRNIHFETAAERKIQAFIFVSYQLL